MSTPRRKKVPFLRVFEGPTLMDCSGNDEFLFDLSELLGAGRTDRTVSGGKLVFVTFRNWSCLRGHCEGIRCFLGLKRMVLDNSTGRKLAFLNLGSPCEDLDTLVEH